MLTVQRPAWTLTVCALVLLGSWLSVASPCRAQDDEDEYQDATAPVLCIRDVARIDRTTGLARGVDAALLVDDGDEVRVPITLRNGAPVDFVQFSIDFDVEWLEPVGVVSRSNAWEYSTTGEPSIDVLDGRIQATLEANGAPRIPPAPGAGEHLVDLVFRLSLDAVPGDAYRVHAPIEFTPYDPTSLTQSPLEQTFVGDRRQVAPDPASEEEIVEVEGFYCQGSIDVFFSDAVEFGSVAITERAQLFTVPVYLTNLEQIEMISIGVDYDELIMRLAGARSVGTGDDVDTGSRELPIRIRPDGSGADFDLRFPADDPAPRLRAHVADLVFELLDVDVLPGEGAAAVLQTPQIVPDALRADALGTPADGAPADGAPASAPRSVAARVLWLEPHFVRGNVDASIVDQNRLVTIEDEDRETKLALVGRLAAPTLQDAVATLEWLFSGAPLACREAADVNDDGAVRIDDPLALLTFLYGGGTPPAAPFPEAGTTPRGTSDLGCDRSLPFYERVPSAAN